MSVEGNKALVQRFFDEVWNTDNVRRDSHILYRGFHVSGRDGWSDSDRQNHHA